MMSHVSMLQLEFHNMTIRIRCHLFCVHVFYFENPCFIWGFFFVQDSVSPGNSPGRVQLKVLSPCDQLRVDPDVFQHRLRDRQADRQGQRWSEC